MSMPKRDLATLFTRRAALLGGLGALGVGSVMARLLYLQTLDPEDYSEAADENRFDTRFVPPPRGIVYDRFGERLAITSRDYRVSITPEKNQDFEAAIRAVGGLIGMSEAAIERRIRDAKGKRRFEETLIDQGLTWEQFSAVNVRMPELPGVRAEAGDQRFYPYMQAFAHPIGYVQRPSERDMERVIERERERLGLPADVPINPPRVRYMRHPEARVGKTGLEAGMEVALQGEPGLKKVEVNAAGRVVSEVTREERPVRPGAGVVLTLDAELQRAAMERLAGESGACVVMDAHSGEILVLASAPGFDPNAFVNGISGPDFRALNEDPYKPLFNKAVKGAYKPGSTFKIATGFAALRAGMPMDQRFTCPGFYTFGGRRFHCLGRHGSIDFRTAMKVSCNVYFYNAALRAGIETLAETSRMLGFDARYDLGMPLGELEKGIIPDPEWFRRVRKEAWPPGNTLNTGIGQGDVLATPLQLALMAARTANGGRAVTPRLIRETIGLKEPTAATSMALALAPDMVSLMLNSLAAVCNEPGGTAYRTCSDLQLVRDPRDGRIVESEGAPPEALKVQMAGKTGTAQVRVITAAERARGVRRNDQLPWHLRDHAVFVWHAPVDQPRYAGAVLVEHGGSGGRIAAPIGRDVARATLLRDPANRKSPTLAELRDPAVQGTAPA